MAAHVGVLRQVNALKNGFQNAHGAQDDNNWQTHVEGACGECTAGKFLGLHWNGNIEKLGGPDVGPYGVRTRSEHWHDLILHRSDPDDRVFILVTGLNGNYVVRGWIFARDGKKPEYWSDPSKKNRWAFFVPQEVLQDMKF